MTSRMQRYEQSEKEERSAKNAQLYEKLQEVGPYSNIEGVVSIETTNEIDIASVKAMMQNRENYQKKKRYDTLVDTEDEMHDSEEKVDGDTKNYDIREFLDKAKGDREEPDSRYRKLRHINYDILEKLKEKAETPEEEEEIQELIDTLTIQNEEIEKTLKALEEEDLFDELKSHTSVGNPESIKKILEEAKEEEEKQEETKRIEQEAEKLDPSFYTSSMGFSKRDFEAMGGAEDEKANKKFRLWLIILIPVAIILFVVLMLTVA